MYASNLGMLVAGSVLISSFAHHAAATDATPSLMQTRREKSARAP